eukprot:CAMPEP_0181293202 /NCGR_PEP_ID=MMETSP1101-20121128/2937_1 /TAXON_ID=46948 /ORGANISM="Rhodomonas abbreviata, Strain Caron Lab Isolate" /LENGTH=68 /DNA_ID=CAMNT_0023397769 /DNA_START=493 /DNA_END=699 /DNA_ORIENTATION=+
MYPPRPRCGPRDDPRPMQPLGMPRPAGPGAALGGGVSIGMASVAVMIHPLSLASTSIQPGAAICWSVV